MEIKISGTPKEIAELALELQGRQKKNAHDSLIQKHEEVDFSAAYKAIIATAKTIHNSSKQQDRQSTTQQDFILTVSNGTYKSEQLLIDRVKELLIKYNESSKEIFSELLQERGFIFERDCDFFYKYNAEKFIDTISKSLIREIWNI